MEKYQDMLAELGKKINLGHYATLEGPDKTVALEAIADLRSAIAREQLVEANRIVDDPGNF